MGESGVHKGVRSGWAKGKKQRGKSGGKHTVQDSMKVVS